MSTIVLFGATGYTGRLVAEALVRRRERPVLAGRNAEALRALAAALGGLPIRTADVADPGSLRALVGRGDVLVTTVGPFARHGHAVLRAAIDQGAHYIDSTGEPAFIREVFEDFDAAAREAGCTLLTAGGYDYVPGNTAGAAALERAGAAAVQLEIGYFATGGRFRMSQGTFASLAGAMLADGTFFEDGRRRRGTVGTRSRRMLVSGESRWTVSASGSEVFALPAAYPRLRQVEVGLGWFGALSPLMSLGSAGQSLLLRLPGMRGVAQAAVARLPAAGRGPDAAERAEGGSLVTAIASDAQGRPLARATLRGVDGYTYTGRMLAWLASQARAGRLLDSGALGPVSAVGLAALVEGNREAGLELSVE